MPEPTLLSSTSIAATSPTYGAAEVRLSLTIMLERFGPRDALAHFRLLAFHSTFSVRSDAVKKALLRGLWSQIETYLEKEHRIIVEAQTALALETADQEWFENGRIGSLLNALRQIANDNAVQRAQHMALGRCSCMVELMCDFRHGHVMENWIKEIEATLS